MQNTIITGGDDYCCGICGSTFKPCENDPEAGICECGIIVDISGLSAHYEQNDSPGYGAPMPEDSTHLDD